MESRQNHMLHGGIWHVIDKRMAEQDSHVEGKTEGFLLSPAGRSDF